MNNIAANRQIDLQIENGAEDKVKDIELGYSS